MYGAFDKFRLAEPNWKSPLIVESHINGLRSKEYNPNIPVGYEEVAEEAIKCWEAGACGIHVHNTDMKLIGTAAFEDYMKVMAPAIKNTPTFFGTAHCRMPPGMARRCPVWNMPSCLPKMLECRLSALIQGPRISPSLRTPTGIYTGSGIMYPSAGSISRWIYATTLT